MRRYSQNDEQAIIADYFGCEVATFMDLGANDGETLSNTRALAMSQWCGVCVDASPQAFERLQRLYADHGCVECFHAAIYSGNGSIVLHESGHHFDERDVALLSTVEPDELDRWAGAGEAFKPVRVPAWTVDKLLAHCKPRRFDLISIDIEGMDLVALQQMDLTLLDCRMLIVEVNDRDPAPYIEHCGKHGLLLQQRNAENLIFAR